MKNNPQQLVEFAALCIQALDAQAGQPLSVQEISRTKGIPLSTCAEIIRRLDRAGIIRLSEANQAVLVRDDVTVLDVLQAVWTPRQRQPEPILRMLTCFASDLQVRKTVEYVLRARAEGVDGING